MNKLLSIKTQTRRATNMKYNLYNANMFIASGFELGVEMSGWGNYELLDEPMISIRLDGEDYKLSSSKLKQILRKNKKSLTKGLL